MNDFKTMAEMAIEGAQKAQSLMAYCDYIAHLIGRALRNNDTEHLLSDVGGMKFDVSPEGAYLSSKKTIEVSDRYGKKYRITVEEA